MSSPSFRPAALASPLTTGTTTVAVLYLLTVLSGLSGLCYEIVWTRMLSVALGHEILAVLAVVAAFFSGLALGALLFDRPVATSRTPGRWFAACELAIGTWALVLSALLPWVNARVPLLLGVDTGAARQWAVAFLIPFLVLLPATVAMGGTLPALERLVSRRRQDGWSVAGVYAANTLGGVAGALLAAFVVVPALGFTATLHAFAAVNALCALAVLAGPGRGERGRAPVTAAAAVRPGEGRSLATLFATGLFGIGYEVLVVRVLSQVLEDTVYTFAAILAIYLLGTAIGAAFYQLLAKRDRYASTLTVLLTLVASLCLAGVGVLWAADALLAAVRGLFGSSMAAAIAAETAVAFAAFFLPTLGMGALFSHLAQAMRGDEGGLGRALAANMAGAAVAPLLVGVLLLPAIGAKAALVLGAVAYLLLIPITGRWALLTAGVPAALAVGLLLFAPPLRFVRVPAGGSLVDHADGVMAAVSVIADARGDRHLQVNTHFRMGGTASVRSDHRQGHIPLLLHADPHRALFLGLGTGATIAAAAGHPGLVADGVELIPEILSTLDNFAPVNGNIATLPQVRLHVADARRFVRASDAHYDVIVADLFHPWVDGAGFLYTREHFEAVRARLAAGGLFCQWLPLHQLDLDTFKLIVRTFVDVFPDAEAMLGTFSLETPIVALVGSVAPRRYPGDWFDARVVDASLRQRLQAVGMRDGFALFGLHLADATELRRFAGDGPLNTDDRPLVLYRAPRTAYALTEAPGLRLLALLQQLHARPEAVLMSAAEGAADGEAAGVTAPRLAAYWAARPAFVAAGLRADPSADVQAFARRTAPDLLQVARISPDFEPAITPLKTMARRLAAVDPPAAEALFGELRAILGQPASARGTFGGGLRQTAP